MKAMENKEYCCTNCGLIWINKDENVICPECGNTGKRHDLSIFACDSKKWDYVKATVKASLKFRNRVMHYHKDHPKHSTK